MSTPPTDEDSSALPRLSPRAWTLVAIGLAALIAGVAWYAFEAAQQPVRWKDVGFSVVSPTEVRATFDVYLYEDTDADCVVRALNPRFTEVGITTVRVERAAGAEQRIDATLATTEEATTAQVQYCAPVG